MRLSPIAILALIIHPFSVPAEFEEIATKVPVAKARLKWWRRRGFLFVSLAAHLLFGLGAASLVVSRSSPARRLTFAAGPKSPNPSERALEHRVQISEKIKIAPAFAPRRILSSGTARVELPPMPSLPVAAATPLPMKMAVAAGGGKVPAESRGSFGGTAAGAPINFFGIRDLSHSVVIMIDVSDSMFNRTGDAQSGKGLVKHGKEQSFQTVRDEAIKLIESLGPKVNFGIVRWAGSANSWKPELTPATDENKKAAIAHIQDEVDMKTARPKKGRPGGTRHDYALEVAFALKPETIYMLTDGNATAAQPGGGLRPIPPEDLFTITDAGQKGLTKRARLHIIYYLNGREKADERDMLMSLAARNNGQFRQVAAPGRKG